MNPPLRFAVLAGLLVSGCKEAPPPDSGPASAPLQVGVSQIRMPVPLGIGTVGFNGIGVPSDGSPFVQTFPATTRIHNHPDFRAIAISRGEGAEVVFVRSDTVGVYQQLRQGLIAELHDRLGKDFDDVLVIGGTHTHSGPGRVVAEGPFEIVADTFFPEFYVGLVDAMADVVEAAWLDLQPGRVGWATADVTGALNDRRCEDGLDYINGAAPILAVEQDEVLTALMLAVPIHGTVLGIDALTLSQDVSGGIEQAVEDRFDHPVQVQMFNSWGADMQPGHPGGTTATAAVMPDGYDQMEEVGHFVAGAVALAMEEVAWEDDPTVRLQTHRVPINRDAIGYDDGVFEFEYGGVYCSGPEDCDLDTIVEDLDNSCVPLNEELAAPRVTEISAGRVGRMHLVTFPGEPGTLLAEQVLEGLGGFGGVEQAVFLGYSQDYIGYSILEDDWWQGGYEASGAIWGPRQGEYLADEAVRVFAQSLGLYPGAEEPAPVKPYPTGTWEPYAGPAPVDLGTVLADVVSGPVGPTEVITMTVLGDDPWFGAPVAWLEHADGTPVLRPGGTPWHSDGQAFWVDLAVEPPYADGNDMAERAYQWTFSMPVSHRIASAGPALQSGDYRLRVVLPEGSSGEVEVVSGTFSYGG